MYSRHRAVPARPLIRTAVAVLLWGLLPASADAQRREYIYAGERLLAVAGPDVTVRVLTASSTRSEGLGPAPVAFQVLTSDGSATPCEVTATFHTVDVTTQPGDYTPISPGSVTFPQGSFHGDTRTVTVFLNNDAIAEPDEAFLLRLTGTSCGALGATDHTVTIWDDEPRVQLALPISDHAENGPGPALIEVEVTTPHDLATTNQVALLWQTALSGPASNPDVATPGQDYQEVTAGNTPILAGTLPPFSLYLPVNVLNDLRHEPAQTFLVQLLQVSGVPANSPPHTVTILSEDPPPVVSIGDAPGVTEGNEGLPNATNATFTVSLSAASEFTVSVNGATADATASTGSDYWTRARTLTFPRAVGMGPEYTSQNLTVPVIGDWVQEPTEQFAVNLTSPVNATLGDSQGLATVTDTDAPGFSVGNVYVAESGVAWFDVSLSPPQTQGASVTISAADGTASGDPSTVDGQDYVQRVETFFFAPGDKAKKFYVPTYLNVAREGPEYFVVNLSDASGAPVAHAQARGWIGEDPAGVSFDTDRDTDLLFRHSGAAGQNVVWLMEGATQVGGGFATPFPDPTLAWNIRGTGDFNLDEKADILWRNDASGQNSVWFMNGLELMSGTFTTPSTLAVGWNIAGTGDFNQDARTDILWHHSGSGQIVLWYMNGTVMTSGTFTTPPTLDPVWSIAGTGDYNFDGKPDLVWTHAISKQLVVWYMNDATLVSGVFFDPETTPGPNWSVAVTRDMDRDGKPDIVWRDSTAGQIVVWYMDGPVLTTGTFTSPPLVDPAWRLVGPR
jgi:hypothetical protein